MEFIESERGNQKLNIKLKKICGGQLSQGGYCPRGAIVRGAIVRGLLSGGQLSGGLLSCSQSSNDKGQNSKTEMERSIKARKLSFYTSSSCSMYSYGIKNLKIKLPESDKKKKSSVASITRYRCLRRRFFSYISQSEIVLSPLPPNWNEMRIFFWKRSPRDNTYKLVVYTCMFKWLLRKNLICEQLTDNRHKLMYR